MPTRKELRKFLDKQDMTPEQREQSLEIMMRQQLAHVWSTQARDVVLDLIRARPDYAAAEPGAKVKAVFTPDELDAWMASQGTPAAVQQDVRKMFAYQFVQGDLITIMLAKPADHPV